MTGLYDAPFDHGGSREVDGFEVVVVGADVADVGEGEGDDLAGIGGVGQDFLVAGHGGVEADFAHGFAFEAKSLAFDHRAVGEDQEGGHAGGVPVAELGARLALAFWGLNIMESPEFEAV